ncbi:translational GTPase TypA [Candidatus Azambacteria bacterium]|nr:translational GTPase TypA [Candidatus Azambacteria bacterium]
MKKIRNIAIIAHVDHGKTTLVDAILKQTAVFRAGTEARQGERIMDSMDLEREKGITIKAKNASVSYKDHKINIIDTPGHADFGGEVERILKMADGVLLLVDAKEGPMPQTKFVLKKALAIGHKAIVVINKIDRPDAQIEEVINKTFDLFVELGADDRQLDFPIIYASGIKGAATLDLKNEGKDLVPLFELILEKIPSPTGDASKPLQILVLNIAYDNYKGKIAIGRIDNGVIKVGENVNRITINGEKIVGKVTNLLSFSGLERVDIKEASAGDIVAVAGFGDVEIGDTIADLQNPIALPPVKVDEPTLKMAFKVNDSPFGGKEGKFGTSRNLRDRLMKEIETNVSLRVEETESADTFMVSGRGELHLAILIEEMRREGYELAVSKPEVIIREIDGVKKEPYENLTIEVPEVYANSVMGTILQRKGIMESMSTLPSGEQHIEFIIPTRGILGLKSALINQTKGTVQMHHVFNDYGPFISNFERKEHGSLISMEAGKIAGFALFNLQERGTLFVGAAEQVYVGQVIGQSARDDDMEVNPCKEKKLTNMRSKGADEAILLTPPRKITIETGIEYIGGDELLEVTPLSLRVRKKILDANLRKRTK